MILDNLIVAPAALNFLVTAGGADAPVNVVTPNSVFKSSGTQSRFKGGEPITIKWIRPMYPYQFGWGASVEHRVGISFKPFGLGTQTIPELGGGLLLANFCETQELGINIRPPANFLLTYELVLSAVVTSVSMQNVPAALNGLTLNPSYLIAVEHTTVITT